MLQSNCIAMLPEIKSTAARPSGKLFERNDDQQRVDGPTSDLLRYVIDNPLSRFSEAVRSLKVAVDLNSIVRENRVVAVTSTLPNEGKSTLATNLAQLIAHAGGKVVLVDADLRNPSLSRSLSAGSAPGLVDAVAQRVKLEGALIIDPVTRLAFLPAGTTSQMLHTSEVLASKAMHEFIAKLRSSFEYVIIDMPPMAPVVDVRVTASFVDSYIFVVEWGKTRIDAARQNLRSAPEIQERLLGVVLNKADTGKLARYESHLGKYYYNKYYARYGYSE